MKKSTYCIYQNGMKLEMSEQVYESERKGCMQKLDDLINEHGEDYKQIKRDPRYKLYKAYWKQLRTLDDIPF